MDDTSFTPSSGNVFEDLGLPNAGDELLKTRLALEIGRLIKKKGMTQAQAAKLLGESQPNISMIVGGRLQAFSIERLLRHLTALGMDIELNIKHAPSDREKGSLIFKEPA